MIDAQSTRRRAVAVALLAGVALLAPAPALADPWHVSVLPVDGARPFSSSEPGVAAGPGAVVANASTANSGSPATFWLSRDGGAHWSRGMTIGGDVSTGDSDAAIGSDGTLYALVLGYGSNPQAQPSNPTVLVYRSRDGRRWLGPASFPPPHGADQPDRPWLVIARGHPDRVLVFNSEGGGNIVEWRSTDGGASFQGPLPVTGGPNAQEGLALGSRPIVDPTHPSRMRLFYETAAGAADPIALSQDLPDLAATLAGEAGAPPSEFPLTQLWVAASDDGGATWTNRLVLDAAAVGGGALGHLLPAPATDAGGHLYVVLSVRANGGRATRLYLMHSLDGARWSAPRPIATGLPSNVMPALAAAAPGRLFLSWYGSDAADFADPAARWSEMVATSTDALGADPRFAVARLGGPVHVGGIDNAGAVGSDLGGDWALRDFQGIATDPCGRPHVTWAADVPSPRTYAATLTAARCRGS